MLNAKLPNGRDRYTLKQKEDVLNNKMKKDLMKFLNTFNDKWNMTNWQRLLMEWNDNNSSVEVDEDSQIPNYMGL